MRNFKAPIIIKDGKLPVYAKALLIPFAMKHKVVKELEKLEEGGIVERLTRSDCGDTAIAVSKPGRAGLRLCGDHKVTLNAVL